MRNLVLIASLAMFFAVPSMVNLSAQDDDEPKYTMKQVMTEGMKGGLVKKVINGDASDEEMEKFVEMSKTLAKYEPKKGDADDWKKRVETIQKALKGIADGDDDAAEALKKATNCADCHKAHKPS